MFSVKPFSLWLFGKCLLLLLFLFGLLSFRLQSADSAAKEPFSGYWVSKQYTNGREFILYLQQDGKELRGWEGHLPPDLSGLDVDLVGSIGKGNVAELEVKHRRGYQARARLSLRSGKLVWQLLESDNRSSRYFPLASTLLLSQTESPRKTQGQEAGAGKADTVATEQGEQAKFMQKKIEKDLLLDILAGAQMLESEALGEAGEPSTYFSAYKALLKLELPPDDPGLKRLIEGKSAAGRIYAAALIWEKNHESGLAAFSALKADRSPLKYRSGCELLDDTVGGIAAAFVDKGSYLDFPARKY